MISKEKQLPGHFITLEGGEGSGKSTLLQQLKLALHEKGHEVVITREPGGSKLGDQIREWLLKPQEEKSIGHLAELFLFLSARAQHVEELILPSLMKGQIVICDRFTDSTLAYQGIARALDLKMVKQLCEISSQTIHPELTLFLDVNPELGLHRSKEMNKKEASAGALDRLEREHLDFHIKVQQAFQMIAAKEPLRVYTIDANQLQSHVLQEALHAIEKLILLPPSKNS